MPGANSLISRSGRIWVIGFPPATVSVPAGSPGHLRTTLFFPTTPLPLEPQFDFVRVLQASLNVQDSVNTGQLSVVTFDFGVAFGNNVAQDQMGFNLGGWQHDAGNGTTGFLLDQVGVTIVQPTQLFDLHIDAIVNKPTNITNVQFFVDISVNNADNVTAHSVLISPFGLIELFDLR